MQLNVMSAPLVAFLAGDPGRRALAGDQLYLDLDLSHDNLPAGSRLTIGDPPCAVVIEVTDQPHTGREVRRALRGRGDAVRQRRRGPPAAAARAQRPGRRARSRPPRRPGDRDAPLTRGPDDGTPAPRGGPFVVRVSGGASVVGVSGSGRPAATAR